MPDDSHPHYMIALLRRRDFTLVWLAGLISLMGDWVLMVALPIYVFELTGSALATSAMGVAEMIPALFLGSVAGVFVDRWNRKQTMVVANVLLTLALLPLLLVHAADRVWIVYAVSFATSVVAQFFTPAESAFLPALAGERDLVAANSLNSLNSNLARLVGPAVGGIIAARFGLVGVTLVDAVSFILAAVLVAFVSVSGRPQQAAADAIRAAERAWRAVWREWLAGLAIIQGNKTVAVMVAMIALSALGEGVMGVIFVVWVSKILHGGAQYIGDLMSAQAVGGILGGVGIAALGNRLSPIRLAKIGPLIFGLGDMALFSYPLILSALWPGLILIALVGFPAATMASWRSLLQSGVPDAYRGRVFGTLGTTQSLMHLAGILLAGILGNLVNPIVLLDGFQGGSYVLAGIAGVVLLGGVAVTAVQHAEHHPVEAASVE